MKHTLHRSLLLWVASVIGLSASAAAPDGYYDRLNGKRDAALKEALRSLIYNHTEVSSYDALPSYFQRTDIYPGTNRWWDMYSDMPIYLPWSGKLLNREHAFPKSWWGGGKNTPAYVDLNHLYPAEAAANMAKSNWPLGEVASSPSFDNDWVLVGPPVSGQGGGAQKVFEPNDEYKGDFARTYFYMVTCYSNLTWASKYDWMLQQNDYPTLDTWAVNLLLKWHKADPVSQKEEQRNDVVYSIQNNRNPFIDHPELADYIWGDKRGIVYDIEVDPDTDPTLLAPSQDMALDFNQIAVGSTSEAKLFFNGKGLTSVLNVMVYRGDKDMFIPSASTVDYRQANSDAGTWLSITYKPAAIGTHTARLLVSGGGMAGSVGVELRGECLAVPQLATLTATDATEIADDSYMANWREPSTGSAPDYYVVTRTRYIAGTPYTEELEAETNSLLIEGFASSDYETYSVQSCSLGYRSEPSNVITVRPGAGISSVKADDWIDLTAVEGGVYVTCGRDHTSAAVYDALGRLVCRIAELTDGMVIPLSPGCYVLTTSASRPVKLIVE